MMTDLLYDDDEIVSPLFSPIFIEARKRMDAERDEFVRHVQCINGALILLLLFIGISFVGSHLH